MTSQTVGTTAPVDLLAGVTVIEVTTGVAAPLIGRVLGELGATVVKVESRKKPDVNRMRLPRPDDPEGFPASEAFQLLHEANAGKKSVMLNLKSAEGKAIFIGLLREADVFIENFAPGWLDRLDLPPSKILDLAPNLVMLSASGYGQTGPLRTQRAYAPVMTSLAGIERLVGYSPDEVMGASSIALADLNCSFFGVYLVLAALHGRRHTGIGQHIDLSQTEACASLIGEAFVEQQLGIRTPQPYGNQGVDGERWSVMRAAEDDTWIAGGTGRDLRGVEELREIERPLDRPKAAELLKTLADHGFESAPVLSPDEVTADVQFARMSFLQQVTHPLALIGELTITSLPWLIDGVVPEVSAAAPRLGIDTDEFFRARMSPEQFRSYSESGVFS